MFISRVSPSTWLGNVKELLNGAPYKGWNDVDDRRRDRDRGVLVVKVDIRPS
jgi:hypothetical protein